MCRRVLLESHPEAPDEACQWCTAVPGVCFVPRGVGRAHVPHAAGAVPGTLTPWHASGDPTRSDCECHWHWQCHHWPTMHTSGATARLQCQWHTHNLPTLNKRMLNKILLGSGCHCQCHRVPQ